MRGFTLDRPERKVVVVALMEKSASDCTPPADWVLFVIASVVLLVGPGASVVLVVAVMAVNLVPLLKVELISFPFPSISMSKRR